MVHSLALTHRFLGNMTSNGEQLVRVLKSPAGSLGLALLLAFTLALVPSRWTDPLRSVTRRALQPGQQAAAGLRGHGERSVARVKSHFRSAGQLDEAQRELAQLREENRRLAAELDAARAQSADADRDPSEQLLHGRCISARVLGRQARAFLARHQMLDAGADDGVEPEALVLDGPAMIDRGADSQLKTGQPVLSGGRVWGKIVRLGPSTSVVRSQTEPGYRDLVHVGSATGPQGVLEGSGELLCRVRLVDVTAPVSIGDPVFTAAGKGILPTAPLCGRIVRLERPVGAACWEIWLQPAVDDEPDRVAVLRTELSSVRVAEKR
ncbi:MAG: hypothetical protein HQ567_26265 [Candidatus Nealsonbacteria bacterium]|nr:hypothetical protein [Candidatus Nealsonbacteria bacterium]